jgi:hypothetical protein
MDEAQVKALLTALLGDFKTTFMTEISGVIDQKNAGTAANMARDLKVLKEAIAPLTKPEDPKPDPAPGAKADDPTTLQMKALQQQLAELQKQSEAERTAALESDKSALIANLVASGKFVSPGIAQDLLKSRWGGQLTKEDGRWFLKDGDRVTPVDEAFKTFTTSDEGKFFLPASGTQGAGSTESKTKSSSATSAPANSADAFGAAFANFGG